MSQSGELGISLPRRLAVGVLVAAAALALTWLYIRAEAVEPMQHFDYTYHLRSLGQINTQIDGELLANRLELSRNYDALTDHTRRLVETGAKAAEPPNFLPAADRAQVLTTARALQEKLQRKADMVGLFKRENSVLRNSLAYFPVAVAENAANRLSDVGRRRLDEYARYVLTFARAPSASDQARIAGARHSLLAAAMTAEQRRGVDNLLRHGDLIVSRLSELDKLTQQIFNLRSAAAVEGLSQDYADGHAAALALANRYRLLLYATALLGTAYLAYTFIRLDRTRRLLSQALQEAGVRLAAQFVAEKQLQLHATAFRSAHNGIALTDAEGNILDANPAFTRITGWERSEVIGRNPRVLKSGRHDRDFYVAMWKSIMDTGNWRGEIWNRNKYGEIYPELLSISAVRDDTGTLSNFVAVFDDISHIKDQEKQLTRMAYYDALTELPNRALLADRLIQGISQTRRTQTLMAICYLDLDGFKPVNDTWGHDVGDQLLVEMASRLRAVLRGGDTAARLGGDEFVLLLLGMGNPSECGQAVQRLLGLIAQPLLVAPQPITLSASIGVALFPLDEGDPDTLLRHADQAMYQAKQAGKNRYHIFDAEQDRFARSRFDHIERIRQALKDDELVLHYQPKVNMREGLVVGAEALIRWHHPERGLVAPGDFLPLIENDDLILDIGDWVIEAALVQMEAWRAAGLELAVSVNIAGRQLQSHDFVSKLRITVDRHPAVTRRLELEVLETTALEDVVKVSRVIDECREMGIHFALDDFGTGYSSLTYLKRLPAEIIKIDQSFVREILGDVNNLAIVQGVIGLANAFQRRVIAEGVETAHHGRLLMQLNCDLAQGYGIAKPMPGAQLADWVAQWRPDPTWQAIRDRYWDDADFPMLAAEVEIRNWVAQVVYTTNEGQPVPHKLAGDACRCRFGTWYYGRESQRHARIPAFTEIEAPHQGVHRITAAIDRHWRDGHPEQARALVPELLVARDDMLATLYQLQLAVAVRR